MLVHCDTRVCVCVVCSQLQEMGWTQQMISEKVKEAAVNENEDLYGTIYGHIGER